MISVKNAPRLLGAAFLLVILTSLASGILHSSAVESEDIADILVEIEDNEALYRISIVAELANAAAILVLAMLLYTVLNGQNKIIARVALGWWLAEGITLAVSKLGAFALIPLSQDFVSAGTPDGAYFQAVGEALYEGLDRKGYTLHMLFYCLGGIGWYYLFFQSRFVPRPIAILGLVAAPVGLVGIVAEMLGTDVSIAVYLPIGVFELAIGFWLLFRGVPDTPATPATPASPATG
ncbi:MAG: DUF4386 domain-containing protein [Chloroflexi bacterium]|nr:DUF4386 domain-containing protein [Chloroflexota bacterium]